MLKSIKLISGGQTGADRAAIDLAIALGIDYGRIIPKGRKTEEGLLDYKYDRMTELDTSSYAARTERNVLDADATLVFTLGITGPGTAMTLKTAKSHRKPCLHIDLAHRSDEEAIERAREWLESIKPKVLNVAGSRESQAKGIYARVYDILLGIIGKEQLSGRKT